MSNSTLSKAGTYIATYTDANGNTNTQNFILTVNAAPTATITSTATSFCSGGSVVLTANAANSYKWFNGTTQQVETVLTYTASSAGSYTVEVTNANACKATSAIKVITVTAATTWYADTDNDGKGDPTATLSACVKPNGYVAVAGDNCPTDANKITPGNCGCNHTESSCLDCVGVPNGSATIDACLVCSGGTTGITPITNVNQCNVSTGNVNVNNLQGIQVMPNPFYDHINLTIPTDAYIQVINSKGAIVFETTDVKTIETSNFAVGLYMLRIITENGVSVFKIEKQ